MDVFDELYSCPINTDVPRNEAKKEINEEEIVSNEEKMEINEEQYLDESNIVPYIGQVFNSLQEAEKYYRDYGKSIGFEVIIKTTKKHSNSDDICSRLYQCRKGGVTYTPKDQLGQTSRCRDYVERTMCKARMFVVHSRKENNWRITSLEKIHNHELVSPSKIQFMQTYNNVTPVARNLIETFHKSGAGASLTLNVLSTMSGGLGNVGFFDKEVRNVVRDIRRNTFEINDAQSALEYLKQLQSESGSKFYFNIRREDNNRVSSIMWVDSWSMLNYSLFGDVVSFDTTYRTNKYSMPFAPFTGVNHHNHSILFGFALLKDETDETFVWLFENFYHAVNNKAPVTIITDQDRAMSNAIARVFPQTHHVLCSWHISSKYPEKLHQTYAEYPDFKDDFNRCVKKSLTISEFEERWVALMDKYELNNHDWLQGLYAVKEKWIRAYTKRYFAAGMTTTSRSEGMNSFFDEFVGLTTGLRGFIQKSMDAVEKQFLRAQKEDNETNMKNRKLLFKTPLEKHASNVYMREMYKKFQEEIVKSLQFTIRKIPGVSSPECKFYTVYKNLTKQSGIRFFTVAHVKESDDITCSCQKFTHFGILCRHIITLLVKKGVEEIPAKYVLHRWTRNANKYDGPTSRINRPSNFTDSLTMRFNYLCRLLVNFAAEGSCTIEGTQYVEQLIQRETPRLMQFHCPTSERVIQSNKETCEDEEEETEEPLLDPICSNTKGRKKEKRLKKGIEEVQQQKPLRKCAICKSMTNHDKRNHYRVLGLPDPKF